MYTSIKQMKEQGFSQTRTAKELNIHRKTVKRYWNMSADEYENYCNNICKSKFLDEYRQTIISWLKNHPAMSSAQICDWLKESYCINFKERTVSRYVRNLRSELSIPKSTPRREYMPVQDLPMGKQLQVDFGEMWMPQAIGNSRVKVRFAVCVLSHSRYKFVYFQSRPFCTVDLIIALRECFKYFGGIPSELVFDQDSIVCVSENYGDVIYTHGFEQFRQECKFNIFMCRPADPESKGKVENAVRYVKHGFLENRVYPLDDEILNKCGLDWLERTANAKIHGTTRKIPAEMFKEEREYLMPIPVSDDYVEAKIIRTVRKDNTVLYCSNRYTLPIGTYPNQKEIELSITDNTISFYTLFHDFICEHKLSVDKGKLISNTDHYRDKSHSLDALQEELNTALNHKADTYLSALRTEKARYARDQFNLLKSLIEKYASEKVLNGIDFCENNSLYSINSVKDFIEYSEKQNTGGKELKKPPVSDNIPVDKPIYHITAAKRSVDIYAKAGALL